MSSASQLFLGLVGVVALADWFALTSQNRQLERMAKPAVMVGLLAVVVTSDLEGWPLMWLLAGLAAGLVGDVLLLPEINQFIGGLGAFFLGHVAYTGLALWYGTSTGRLVIGLLAMTVLVMTVGSMITDALRESVLFAPVVAYVVTIGASTALMIGTGRWLMATGAVLFALSDTMLGWRRFIGPTRGGRLAEHVTYHLGQVLIAVGAIT